MLFRSLDKGSDQPSLFGDMADEVFDSSLDGFGTEEFLKIIRFVIKDANIFVISHKTGMEDKFDTCIKFEKIKGFSRMMS